MERFKYRVNKANFLFALYLQKILVKLFYKKYPNSKLEKIITENRIFLDSIDTFLTEDVYVLDDYGIQERIYNQLDNKISDLPTYSDFIVFLINNVFKKSINYLEIGVSVLKNYLQ